MKKTERERALPVNFTLTSAEMIQSSLIPLIDSFTELEEVFESRRQRFAEKARRFAGKDQKSPLVENFLIPQEQLENFVNLRFLEPMEQIIGLLSAFGHDHIRFEERNCVNGKKLQPTPQLWNRKTRDYLVREKDFKDAYQNTPPMGDMIFLAVKAMVLMNKYARFKIYNQPYHDKIENPQNLSRTCLVKIKLILQESYPKLKDKEKEMLTAMRFRRMPDAPPSSPSMLQKIMAFLQKDL